MKTTRMIGIWMDHKRAHLMEFTSDSGETKTIDSEFTHDQKEENNHKGEHGVHNKEQHQQSHYFKALGETIKQYESVLLFGPTEAKTELYNILTADQHFANIKIEVRQSDKMTENQEHAFVKKFFLEN